MIYYTNLSTLKYSNLKYSNMITKIYPLIPLLFEEIPLIPYFKKKYSNCSILIYYIINNIVICDNVICLQCFVSSGTWA